MPFLIGFGVEVLMSFGVIGGVADRACAFVLAGYRATSALLCRRCWAPVAFWGDADGKARGLFWDFLKNLSLGAGCLPIVVGADSATLKPFLDHSFASSQPYAAKNKQP